MQGQKEAEKQKDDKRYSMQTVFKRELGCHSQANTLLSGKCYERRRTLDTDEKFTLPRK